MIHKNREMADLYRDFLPSRVFDAHMHLYLAEASPLACNEENSVFTHKVLTPKAYWEDMQVFLPGVEYIGMNMIPMPDPVLNNAENGLRNKANEHAIQQSLQYPECVATPYILPSDREEYIRQLVDRPGVKGLKCYYYARGAKGGERWSAGDFLSEAAWVVANERKIPIILHLMRPHALADPDNFDYIIKMSHRYPDAQLVLAHCGRAFASWTAVSAVQKLEDCGNIWFDMSGICETGPMIAAILKNGGKRTMWGSDYPVCMNPGKAISLGTGQEWLIKEGLACVAAENLLALWQVSLLLNLDATQIEDLFYKNACSLFGL